MTTTISGSTGISQTSFTATTLNSSSGAINATLGATTPSTVAATTISASGAIKTADAGTLGWGAATTALIGTSAGSNIDVYTGGVVRANFSSTGLAVTGALSASNNLSLTSGGTSLQWTNAGNNVAVNATAGALSLYTGASSYNLAATLDTSGNLGLGVTPTQKFHIGVAAASTILQRIQNSTNDLYLGVNGTGECQVSSNGNYPIIFATNAVEKMRLDASGNLLVGAAPPAGSGKLTVTSTTGSAARFYVNLADGTAAVQFDKSSTTNTTSQVFAQFTINAQTTGAGQINANGASAVAFGAFSDRRLKENITDLPSQLSNILALRPVEFDYIASEGGGHQLGFIAQEVQEIYPDLVGERADGMLTLTDMNKNDARLIKAIQEMHSLISAQADAITALTQRLTAAGIV